MKEATKKRTGVVRWWMEEEGRWKKEEENLFNLIGYFGLFMSNLIVILVKISFLI